MGKKNDIAKLEAAVAEVPAPKKTTKARSAEPLEKSAVATNGEAKKPVRAKKTPVAFSTEDIALRAYFIAERRQRDGIHGDEHSDWIEAERQLLAESKKKASKKPATAKKRA